MIGLILGLAVGAVTSLTADVSWWWLFAWGPGGALVELLVRLRAGEDASAALADVVTFGLSSLTSSGGDYDSGGDSGGCSGGDSGGGDSGGCGGD